MTTEDRRMPARRTDSTAADRDATTSARAGFDAARRGRSSLGLPQTLVPAVAMRETAPGVMQIARALGEAIFVEPIRSMRGRVGSR